MFETSFHSVDIKIYVFTKSENWSAKLTYTLKFNFLLLLKSTHQDLSYDMLQQQFLKKKINDQKCVCTKSSRSGIS